MHKQISHKIGNGMVWYMHRSKAASTSSAALKVNGVLGFSFISTNCEFRMHTTEGSLEEATFAYESEPWKILGKVAIAAHITFDDQILRDFSHSYLYGCTDRFW